jgi:branched-chain amino acid transport system substrate-binding protein
VRVHRSAFVPFAVALLLAAVAVSCGDDDSDGGTSGSDGKVVKIGVIAPLDAGLTSFGHGIENSVRLAVDQANAEDAITGWEIEVDAQDDSSDPVIGAQAAETIAGDDAVIGVVGTYNSGVAAEVAPVLDQAGIAMISPSNTDPTLTIGPDRSAPSRQFDTYFRMVATDAQQGPFLASYATEDLGAQTVAIVSETKAVSRGLADDFSAAFTEAGGEVVYDMTVPDGTTDFATVVDQIAPLNPDLLFFGGEYEVAAAFRTAAAGIAAPLMGGDGIKDDAYIAGAGARSEGDLAGFVGAPLATLETAADFRDDYEAAGFADPSTDYGPYAYDAANLLIDAAAVALEDEDRVTPEAREVVIEQLQGVDLRGATGAIAFDEFGDTITKVLTMYQVTDGAWVAVDVQEVG